MVVRDGGGVNADGGALDSDGALSAVVVMGIHESK